MLLDKKTIAGLLSLFILLGSDISGQDQNADQDSLTAIADSLDYSKPDSLETVLVEDTLSNAFQVPKVENRAFLVGELLVFDVAYGFVIAGSAVMAIPDTQWIHNRPCYRIMTEARSSKFFSKIFEVRDRVVSFVDMEGLFPWRFEKHLREGKYRSDKTVLFDQINHRVIEGKDTVTVQPFIQDILSSFYFFRILDLKVGKPIDIDNYGDGKIYPLRVLVLKKEKIEVPAGTFRCIVVEPVMRVEGIFNQTGQLRIWLTDDERRIPVLMKSKVLIGSIDARLRKIGKVNKNNNE
jgi:hypothetical protein